MSGLPNPDAGNNRRPEVPQQGGPRAWVANARRFFNGEQSAEKPNQEVVKKPQFSEDEKPREASLALPSNFTPNETLQSIAMDAMLRPSKEPLDVATNTPPQLPSRDQALFFLRLVNNEINQADIDDMLLRVKAPLSEGNPFVDINAVNIPAAEMMRVGLENNRQGKAIIADMVGKGMENRDLITAADLAAIFRRDPTPAIFEGNLETFLSGLAKVNSPSKIEEYKASARRLEIAMYGDRFLIWEQTKALLLKGGRKSFSPRTTTRTRNELGRWLTGTPSSVSGPVGEEDAPPIW